MAGLLDAVAAQLAAALDLDERDVAAMLRDTIMPLKQLPDGECLGLTSMIFTTAVVLVESDYAAKAARRELGYRRRFCYEHKWDAWRAAAEWDGQGDPPGFWVKEKSRNVDRLNPALAREDFGA